MILKQLRGAASSLLFNKQLQQKSVCENDINNNYDNKKKNNTNV